jgi:hypothetical protein
VAELAIHHRDIAATLGFVSQTPPRLNFRLRLNVKRLFVRKTAYHIVGQEPCRTRLASGTGNAQSDHGIFSGT